MSRTSVTKIERLTPAQEQELVAWRQRWFEIGSSCERADRVQAETAIIAMYAEIGEPAPKFLWVDSPATGCLAIHLLKHIDSFMAPIGDRVWTLLSSSLAASLTASLDDSLEASLKESLWTWMSDSIDQSLREALRVSLSESLRVLWGSLRGSLGASLKDALPDLLRDSIRAALRTALWDSLNDSLRSSLNDSFNDSLKLSFKELLSNSLSNSMKESLRASLDVLLCNSLWGSLEDSFWDSLSDSLMDSLLASLRDSLSDSLETSLRELLLSCWYGQHEVYWIACYLFARDVLGVQYDPKHSRQLDLWAAVSQSCCWWWPFRGLCVVSERPTLVSWELDRSPPRIHSLTGPVVTFADGWKVYAVRGMRVPERFIEHPETIRSFEIQTEQNVELRRLMIERFGAARYLREIGAVVVDEDIDGVGKPRRLLRAEFTDDESLTMIELTNSSPGPDGTYRLYHLRVPPTMRTCHEAVAWTFDMEPDAYRPVEES